MMIRNMRSAVACSLGLMLCLAGCGSNNGPREISGTVTYEGHPLAKGSIVFLPVDGQGPTAATLISQGKYSVKVFPGSKQVKIKGFKVIGQKHYQGNPSNPLIDVQEQTLPACYNEKTILFRDIAPTDRVCDFILEKSPAR